MTVTLATFMEVLDSSIANVASPHIAGGLGATQDEATWVLTAYLVANAIILPAGAYMTTFIGRKKFYMICVALFGISSALCGFAPSLPILDLLPHPAGSGRRRTRPVGASDSRRYLSTGETWPGLCDVRPRRRLRARDRSHTRRLHHGQLRLAMDLLPQRSHLPDLAVPYIAHRRRSALGEEAGRALAEGRHQTRLSRLRSAWPYLRLARVHPRQGPGGRLVLISASSPSLLSQWSLHSYR